MYTKYLKYLCKHKLFVFLECYKLRIPFLGLIHDWSKFRLSEFIPYARHFYGSNSHHKNSSHAEDDKFNLAWLLHQKRNKHHWQWWINIDKNIISKYTNTNDDKGRYCQCLNLRKKIQKLAQDVIGHCQEKNLYTAVKSDEIVQNVTQKLSKNIEKEIGMNINHIKKNICLLRITKQKNVMKQNKEALNTEKLFLNIMEVILLNVLVVVNHIMNFLHWIISMVVDKNIEKNTHKGKEDSGHIGGQLRMIFHRFLESFVITVIPHMDSMDIVHIKKTVILLFDEGDAKCMFCEKEIPKNALIPFEMPLKYRKEMLADWRGAGRAQGAPDTKAWYEKNKYKMQLGIFTRKWIEVWLNN